MIFKSEAKNNEFIPIGTPMVEKVDHTIKVLELGLGLPPVKYPFQDTSDYGAMCMLKGYRFAKKKYKKQIKKLKKHLEEKQQ